MAIMAKDDGGGAGNYEIAPAGMQPAVFSKVFDVGIQHSEYNGEIKDQHKVVIVWELDARISEGEFAGERFVLSKTYTLSLHEKANLRKDIESYKSKTMTDEQAKAGYDLEKLITCQCTLNVLHYEKKNGYTGAKIGGVFPAGKDDPILFPELEVDWCPAWIKSMIDQGGGATGNIETAEKFEDDPIPF